MSSRHLHPVAARVSRRFRAAIVGAARSQGISVSALIKEAVRKHLGEVDPGVNAPSSLVAPTGPVLQPLPTPLASTAPRKLRHLTASDAAPPSSIGAKAGGYFVERR